MNADLSPTFCVPCCPIDHLNGKEILGALKNIFNYKKLLPGNYLCFSADGLLVASILQTKNNMIEITPTPLLSTSEKKFRFIFSKLFDDDEVIRRRKSCHKSFYIKEVVGFGSKIINWTKILYEKPKCLVNLVIYEIIVLKNNSHSYTFVF